MTVAKDTNTFNHIKLAKTGAKQYEVRGVRMAKTNEKLFVYLMRDVAAGINYEWRLAHGHTFDSKVNYSEPLDRSWKAKEIVDRMIKEGKAVEVKEHGNERTVFKADLILANLDIAETKTKGELLEILNEMAPVVGFTRIDEWRQSKGLLIGRIVQSHGKLDGRKRRRAA